MREIYEGQIARIREFGRNSGMESTFLEELVKALSRLCGVE